MTPFRPYNSKQPARYSPDILPKQAQFRALERRIETLMKEQGGQPKNLNNLVHGAYRNLTALDGRTKEARLMAEVEAALVNSLGGDPSPQQIILIQRIAVKSLRCYLSEREFLRNRSQSRLETDYLSWANSLRADLQLLGMERRAKPVVDLTTYVEENYGSE